MKKTNVWELAKKEADIVIKAIDNGEVKTTKEIMDYLEAVYSWNFSTNVMSIVNAYTSVNNIDLPWDCE